jgi:hypothetical protein
VLTFLLCLYVRLRAFLFGLFTFLIWFAAFGFKPAPSEEEQSKSSNNRQNSPQSPCPSIAVHVLFLLLLFLMSRRLYAKGVTKTLRTYATHPKLLLENLSSQKE